MRFKFLLLTFFFSLSLFGASSSICSKMQFHNYLGECMVLAHEIDSHAALLCLTSPYVSDQIKCMRAIKGLKFSFDIVANCANSSQYSGDRTNCLVEMSKLSNIE
jgi:hypothetical protein